MATTILAAGPGTGTSSSFTLAAGEVANLYLVGDGAQPAPGPIVELQIQSVVGWTGIYCMQVPDNHTARVEGPGVFRCVRRTGAQSPVGVERA